MITFLHQNKGSIKYCEDSLTSTVFGLLKYLPTETFWSILKKSLYHQELPSISGEIQEYEYWPKWLAENTGNERYVEPDLFIRFEEFDLLIEAKRQNENQQRDDQIAAQIQAYYNEYEEDNKALYYIQVGGLLDLNKEKPRHYNDKKIVMCKTNWTRLLDQIVEEKDKLEDINYSHLNSYKRIFDNLVKGLELHGYFKKLWLDSLNVTITPTQTPKKLFDYAAKN